MNIQRRGRLIESRTHVDWKRHGCGFFYVREDAYGVGGEMGSAEQSVEGVLKIDQQDRILPEKNSL